MREELATEIRKVICEYGAGRGISLEQATKTMFMEAVSMIAALGMRDLREKGTPYDNLIPFKETRHYIEEWLNELEAQQNALIERAGDELDIVIAELRNQVKDQLAELESRYEAMSGYAIVHFIPEAEFDEIDKAYARISRIEKDEDAASRKAIEEAASPSPNKNAILFMLELVAEGWQGGQIPPNKISARNGDVTIIAAPNEPIRVFVNEVERSTIAPGFARHNIPDVLSLVESL